MTTLDIDAVRKKMEAYFECHTPEQIYRDLIRAGLFIYLDADAELQHVSQAHGGDDET